MIYDFAIVGAGIAGAGLAAELAALAGDDARILLLETEDAPGYHSTGRSAAFWSETYGGPEIVPLSLASGPMLRELGLLTQRGALHMARNGHEAAVEAFIESYGTTGARLERVGRAFMANRVPGLSDEWTAAVWEPACSDIDVDGLHQHYLRTAGRAGIELALRARLERAELRDGKWVLSIEDGRQFAAAVLVDAAGAWADEVARIAGMRELGIRPYRRTVVQIELESPPPPDMPLVLDIDGSFYFKPESGSLWLSPHDEEPSDPCDSAPEELAVAQAIDRFQRAVDRPIARVGRRWAGLRSFAPDRLPVYGHDPACEAFFWFAGQGGFGIQTAPAASRLAAQILTGSEADAMTRALDRELYDPRRFGSRL